MCCGHDAFPIAGVRTLAIDEHGATEDETAHRVPNRLLRLTQLVGNAHVLKKAHAQEKEEKRTSIRVGEGVN